uniref:FAS1 domain-containing protein n=1 Tax=Panagrolaimus sp. JU765 TaxID=591449 RepID=A0AC34PYW7_9BILA
MGPETFRGDVKELIKSRKSAANSKELSCIDETINTPSGNNLYNYFLPNYFTCEKFGKNRTFNKIRNNIAEYWGYFTNVWLKVPWRYLRTGNLQVFLRLKELKNLKSNKSSQFYITSSNYTDNLWAKVVHPNILTTDGVVHIIDKFFDEPTEKSFEILKYLHSTTKFAKEIEKFGNFMHGVWSFIAPTNDAMTTGWFRVFKARKPEIIESFLKIHIIPERVNLSLKVQTENVKSLGGMYNLEVFSTQEHHFEAKDKMTLYGETADIVAKNILGTNGYVHVIDHFIGTPQTTIESRVCSEYSNSSQGIICKVIENFIKRDSSPLAFVTFFAPTEKFSQKIATRFGSHEIWLEDIFKKHLFRYDILAEDLIENLMLPINGTDCVLKTDGNQSEFMQG